MLSSAVVVVSLSTDPDVSLRAPSPLSHFTIALWHSWSGRVDGALVGAATTLDFFSLALIMGRLPSGDQVLKRNGSGDGRCPLSWVEEDMNHIFFLLLHLCLVFVELLEGGLGE